MATEKKMTQIRALEIAANVLGQNPSEENDLAAEVIYQMIEKRRAPRKPRVNADAEYFRERLEEVLENLEVPPTNAELTELMTKFLGEQISPQKVSNNIRVLEKHGIVERIKGEKTSDKDRFALVMDNSE